MAVYYAQNSSVPISVAGWKTSPDGSGDSLVWPPTENDGLYANGKTGIIINENITCGILSTAANGGGFVVNTAEQPIEIIGDMQAPNSTCITQTGGTLIITGDVTGGGVNARGINITGTSTLVVNGKITAGTAANAILVSAGGANSDITINNPNMDAVLGGSSPGSIAMSASAAIVLLINGNVRGGTNSGLNVSGNITINGNIIAAGSYHCVSLAMGTVININGNIFGSDTAGGCGVYALNNYTLNLTGNLIHRIGAAINGANLNWTTGGQYNIALGSYECPQILSPEKVLKGIRHGSVIGTLAPASPFRRLNRLV